MPPATIRRSGRGPSSGRVSCSPTGAPILMVSPSLSRRTTALDTRPPAIGWM